MSVLDPISQAVVDRLQAKARAQRAAMIRHFLPMLPRLLTGRPIGSPADVGFYRDKLLPIGPVQGDLLYLLARAKAVRYAVEFGTSYGVSTVYLAAAIRDAGTGGRVVGTELEPEKVKAARSNLAAAGLTSQV